MITPGVNIPAADVIAGLHTAMSVGMPPDEADRPTFYFKADDETEFPLDPFEDYDVPVAPDPVQVLCAYEGFTREGVNVDFAIVTPTRVKLTLLGAEYALVEGFWYVTIGRERFNYERTDLPYGLGEVSVHTIWVTAQDDG